MRQDNESENDNALASELLGSFLIRRLYLPNANKPTELVRHLKGLLGTYLWTVNQVKRDCFFRLVRQVTKSQSAH